MKKIYAKKITRIFMTMILVWWLGNNNEASTLAVCYGLIFILSKFWDPFFIFPYFTWMFVCFYEIINGLKVGSQLTLKWGIRWVAISGLDWFVKCALMPILIPIQRLTNCKCNSNFKEETSISGCTSNHHSKNLFTDFNGADLIRQMLFKRQTVVFI